MKPKTYTNDFLLNLLGKDGWCPAYFIVYRSKPSDKSDSMYEWDLQRWEDTQIHEPRHYIQFQDYKPKWLGLIVYAWLHVVYLFKKEDHPWEREVEENLKDDDYWNNHPKKNWKKYK